MTVQTEMEKGKVFQGLQDEDIVDFDDVKARQDWISSSETTKRLILVDYRLYNPKIAGIEVDQLVYVYSTCTKCGAKYLYSNIITRAKALLVLAPYNIVCRMCEKRSVNKSITYL